MELNLEEVPGWNNGKAFYDHLIKVLPPRSKVLEMGVFFGRGLIYLAQHSDFEIYGVDSFLVDPTPYLPDNITDKMGFYEGCITNLFKFGVQRQVTLIALDSELGAKLFPDNFFDCVYIDGEHDYESAKHDIGLWKPKVKPGGYLAGDDYMAPWLGVIQAVDEVLPQRVIMPPWTWYVKL